MIKIAIITRTKDRPLLLERAILSVLNQSFMDWQHIIVNDAGDPGCVEKLVQKYSDEYDNRVKIIHNEESKGMERASNIGIKNAQSEYIVILDDDDSWENDFLEKSLEYLEKQHAQGVITHCNYVIEKIENNNVEILQKYPFNTDIDKMTLKSVILSKIYPPPVSFIFERICYDQLNGFNEEFLKAGDIEFILRFLQKFKITVLQKALANYHARPYNQGVQANSTQQDNSCWEKKLSKSLLKTNFELGLIYYFLNKIKPIRDFFVTRKKIKNLKRKKVALYGAGIRAKELLPLLKKLNIVGVFDNSKEKQGGSLGDYKIFAPDKISELRPEILILTVANKTMVMPFVIKLIEENRLNCDILTV